MRRLAIFNIGYGSLGLLSTLLIVLLMPENPLPRPMMVSGGIASAYILASGIVMLLWGDRVLKAVGRFASATIGVALGTRTGRAIVLRTRPIRDAASRIAARPPRDARRTASTTNDQPGA